jgi:NAD(P)-dependent dehydrogenase (short-subunit alcohol dehydrogenase family)
MLQAGAYSPSSVLDTDPERFLALMDVNAAGPIRVVQGFADLLIKTANSKSLGAGKAVVINVASVARHGTAWQVSYDSSKVGRCIFSVFTFA